jgi:hypothetical protein
MISYPREMPCAGVMGQVYEIDRVDYTSPEAGGTLGSVQAGWPLWTTTVDLNNMEEAEAAEWRAFVRTLRGSQRTFLAWDMWRPLPRAHARGFARMTHVDGTAFSGAATGWSQTIAANGDALLTLTGVPAGLRLGRDDLVGFKWDATGSVVGTFDRRTVASVVDFAAADADGAITVTVEPPVPTMVVPAGAIAHLDRPSCIMRQSTKDTKLGRRVLDIDTESGGKLVAMQDLRA